MADDEEAVVLACTGLVFCALDLRQSQEQLLEKVRWTCPPQSTLWRRPCTRVVLVALVVASVSRLLSDNRDTFRHDFSLCQNACRVETRRDMT